jgi:hypothetical protein
MNKQATVTHEQFIHGVRAAAVQRLDDGERAAAMSAKLVYGAGEGTGRRGVTFYGAWQADKDHPLCEVCAFGEDSPIQIAGTTLHELGHVLAGIGKGHGPDWKAACERLGLRYVRAAGTNYSPACFAADVRLAINALPAPTDGKPQGIGGMRANGTPLQLKLRPCTAGVGAKGGKSRGTGSGSRLRKFVCACVPAVIARVARDEFNATCNACGTTFKQPGETA